MKQPGGVYADRVTTFGDSGAPERTLRRIFGLRMRDTGRAARLGKLLFHRLWISGMRGLCGP